MLLHRIHFDLVSFALSPLPRKLPVTCQSITFCFVWLDQKRPLSLDGIQLSFLLLLLLSIGTPLVSPLS